VVVCFVYIGLAGNQDNVSEWNNCCFSEL